jgi:hypothetical protein
MPDSEERIGANEAMFRHVNERVDDINEAFAPLTDTMEIICECADVQCVEQLVMSISEYRRIRSDSALFVVVPGHERPPVAEAIEHRTEGYTVVRKKGEALQTAMETAPRRPD